MESKPLIVENVLSNKMTASKVINTVFQTNNLVALVALVALSYSTL